MRLEKDRDGDFHWDFLVCDGDRAEIGERKADDEAVVVLRAVLRDGSDFRGVVRVQFVPFKLQFGGNLRSLLEVAVDVGGEERSQL